MKRAAIIAAAALALTGTTLWAQEGPPSRTPAPVVRLNKADLPGRVVFEHSCAPCHGAGHGTDGAPTLPGTAALQRRYGGDPAALLEMRADIEAGFIRLFVRNGSGAMPAFRKSELTDAQIDQIAAYLRATAKASKRK
ncbi:MAG: Cytochrome c6 [Pseudomonadota bacterium]|jgi:mono/diheme cytochrome c family protein